MHSEHCIPFVQNTGSLPCSCEYSNELLWSKNSLRRAKFLLFIIIFILLLLLFSRIDRLRLLSSFSSKCLMLVYQICPFPLTLLCTAGSSVLDDTHTHTHTYSVGFLWTRDRPIVGNFTLQHTTHTRDRHTYRRRYQNPQSVANERRQTYSLERAATCV